MKKSPSYERLMEYATRVLKLESEAELAREITMRGYPVSAQAINNWSRRGVPEGASLQIGKAIGIDPIYLHFDEAHPAKAQESNNDFLKKYPKFEIGMSATPIAPTLVLREPDPDERFLIEAFRVADPGMKCALLAIAEKATQAFSKRSETKD